jgi:hypothetical protein
LADNIEKFEFINGKIKDTEEIQLPFHFGDPEDGKDFNDGGMLRSINTWDGCGKDPFAGKISSISCKPSNNLGIFTTTSTVDVYLGIPGGGADL